MADGEPIRVLIVDDHELVAQSLELALGQADGVEVVGCIGTLDRLTRAVTDPAGPPDVVILDLQLGTDDTLSAVPGLLDTAPDMKVVMFSGRDDDQSVARAIQSGCSAYVPKARPLRELVDVVRRVHAGEAVFESRHLRAALARRPRSAVGGDLSAREREVLAFLADGLGADAIAARLHLSRNTVRNHVQNVLTKLNAHSRLEAVAIALREGIIEPH